MFFQDLMYVAMRGGMILVRVIDSSKLQRGDQQLSFQLNSVVYTFPQLVSFLCNSLDVCGFEIRWMVREKIVLQASGLVDWNQKI